MRTDKGLLKIRATDTHQDKLGTNQDMGEHNGVP